MDRVDLGPVTIERLDLRERIVRTVLWDGPHKRASVPMLVVGRVPEVLVKAAGRVRPCEAYELRTGAGDSVFAYAHEIEVVAS